MAKFKIKAKRIRAPSAVDDDMSYGAPVAAWTPDQRSALGLAAAELSPAAFKTVVGGAARRLASACLRPRGDAAGRRGPCTGADAPVLRARGDAPRSERQRRVRRLRALDGGGRVQPLERADLRRAGLRERGAHVLHAGEPHRGVHLPEMCRKEVADEAPVPRRADRST